MIKQRLHEILHNRPHWVFLLAVMVYFAAVPMAGSAPPNNRADQEAIADLMYCYARGTDEIGDATTNADPLAAGLSVYRECFTDDAEFRAWFPQQPFTSQAFPNPDVLPPTPPSPFIGPENWAGFVDGVFRGNGYDFTQHVISNIQVDVHGRHGTLTAYLTASHVTSGDGVGGVSQCVAVANGTYSLVVEKIRKRWLIRRLDVTLITFNPVFQSGPGCGG